MIGRRHAATGTCSQAVTWGNKMVQFHAAACCTWATATDLLNVLHDTTDDDIAILVTQRINIQLNGTIQVLVNKHRPVGVNLYCCGDVTAGHSSNGRKRCMKLLGNSGYDSAKGPQATVTEAWSDNHRAAKIMHHL